MLGAAETTPSGAAIHYAILSAIVDRGTAPGVEQLAAQLGCSVEQTAAALRSLADDHGVVLHPDSARIWVAHPFSLAPTGFLVRQAERSWWGNCAWCSLGIAALLGGAVTITTTLGLEDRQVTIHVGNDGIAERDLLVHFPVPMTNAWDNVLYTCSTMLVFDGDAAVADWCQRHGVAKGDMRPIDQVWRFAREWYGRHLDRDWRKWTADEARAMFARHGLDGPIWDLPASDGRF